MVRRRSNVPVRRRVSNVRANLRSPMKTIGTGILGGVGANIGASVNETYGPGAALALTGYLMKNDVLQVLGGYSLGSSFNTSSITEMVSQAMSGVGMQSTSSGWY